MRLSRHVALCLLLLMPLPAGAQTIGPTQAQALQQQLKDWLSGLLGPSVPLPDLPWKITGAGDHYLLTWPIPALTGASGGAAATARIRPLDGGRWSIDSVTLPPGGQFNITLPDSDAGVGGPTDVTFSIGAQGTRGVLDPSFATESSLHSELSDFVVTTDNSKQRQEQRFDRYRTDTSLKPTADGRLDLVMDAGVDGWASVVQMEGSEPVAIGIQKMRAVGLIKGVSRDRIGGLLTATRGFIMAVPPDADKDSLPAPARAQLRLMVEALQDMLTAVSLEETLEGVQVEMPGVGALSIKRFLLGFGGQSPDGRLRAWVDLGIDELDSPSLPPELAAYLPRHIAIKPTLSGIQTADLHKLLLRATEEDGDAKLEADAAAIFAHGPINIGLETLAFDLGPAKVEGTGQLALLSPDTWHGTAHVVASGFDELTAKARTSPELQQALPVLIMMRGLAKPDGQRLVWDIVSDGPQVTVNGLDLSKLGSDDKSKGKAPPPKRPTQPPSR